MDVRTMLATWAVIALACTAAELVDPLVPRERWIPHDVPWFACYLVVAPLIAACTQPVLDLVGRLPTAPLSAAPFAVRTAVALVVFDAVSYALHRAMHTTALWRYHRVHHESTDITWWTAFRAHPVSALVSHAVPLTAAAAVGVGTDAITVTVTVVFVVTIFGHANVWVPRALEQVIATPTYHRRHHEPDGHGHNLALLFPVVDSVFRTRSAATPQTPSRRSATRRPPTRRSLPR